MSTIELCRKAFPRLKWERVRVDYGSAGFLWEWHGVGDHDVRVEVYVEDGVWDCALFRRRTAICERRSASRKDALAELRVEINQLTEALRE